MLQSTFVRSRRFSSSLGLVGLALVACSRPAAAPVAATGCPLHEVALNGACVSDDDVGAYCGKASTPTQGGCVLKSCPEGAPVDLGSGECVSARTLARRGEARGVEEDGGAPHPCKGDAWLAVEGPNEACLPPEARCGRGAEWKAGECRPAKTCPRGTIADGDTCVAISRRERGEELVDIGAWLRLAVGPDGGDGRPALCGPLAQRPWLAGVAAHGHAVVDVEAQLVFPDNDVSRAEVRATARRRFDPRAVGATTALAMTDHLEPLWKALRALGGTANAASATIAVHCDIFGGEGVAPAHEDASAPNDGGKPAS